MRTLIAVLLLGGSALAAILYHYRFAFLNIEKARIKKRLAAGESQSPLKKTRLNRTAIKVILVALAIILFPITIATAFFGFIWFQIANNLSGGILLLIGYYWIAIVALATRYLYSKLGIIIIVAAIGALIPPLLSAFKRILEYMNTRYELALQQVKHEVSIRDNEERIRLDVEQKKAEEIKAKEALTGYEKAAKLDPNDAEAWLNQSLALHRLGRNKEALEAIDKATSLLPHDAYPLLARGILLHNLKLYNGALESLQKSADLDPKDTDVWLRMGWVFWDLHRHKDALKAFEKGLILDPDDADLKQAREALLSELRERKNGPLRNLEAYEDYYSELPVYGFGDEGMNTSEFAEIIGEDSNIARRVLESWRALGRAIRRPSGREYKWWSTGI